MVFSSEAYERAFPRKTQEAVKVPEQSKPGNVLEEVDKIDEVKKIEEPTPIETPAADPIEPEGGVNDGA